MIFLKDKELCVSCGVCESSCPFDALHLIDGYPVIESICTECGSCVRNCPVEALDQEKRQKDSVNKEEYKDIWVIDLSEQALSNITLELLSKARELAEQRDSSTVLVTGKTVDSQFADAVREVGCTKILTLTAEYETDSLDYLVGGITQAILSKKPEIVLFPASADGRDVAPKVACRLKTGLTADCTGLDIDEEGNLLQIRPTYGGSIMATIRTPNNRPQMATIRAGIFDIVKNGINEEIKTEFFEVKEEETFHRVQHIARYENSESFVSLDEAEIILAGGYGLGSKENFDLLYKLADKLGAAVGATRKAVDEGWASPEIQIGQTGKVVKPKKYIAFGISGAFQHTLGMKKSGKIIAINNDPAAPIFQISDKAILGDATEIIKEMIHSK